eukprot:15471596-Alexandrium_andersonii.AAC.1
MNQGSTCQSVRGAGTSFTCAVSSGTWSNQKQRRAAHCATAQWMGICLAPPAHAVAIGLENARDAALHASVSAGRARAELPAVWHPGSGQRRRC